MVVPATLNEAIERAEQVMTEGDWLVLRGSPLDEAQWKLHFTLGHTLRNELGLWTPDAEPLYKELMDQVPDAFLVVDGDTASGALISALWRRAQVAS